MNGTRWLAAIGAAALLAGIAAVPQDGKKAPDFSGKTADGKAVSLKSLTAKGPVYLYFIKGDCPVNARAMPFYKKIFDAYGKDEVPLLGVINADAAGFKEWNDHFKAKFPVLLDPEMKTITAYGAERSPWVVEVKKDGTLGKKWEGYSQLALEELNKALALAEGRKPIAIDMAGAPSRLTYG